MKSTYVLTIIYTITLTTLSLILFKLHVCQSSVLLSFIVNGTDVICMRFSLYYTDYTDK